MRAQIDLWWLAPATFVLSLQAHAADPPHGLLPQGCDACHPTRSYPGLSGNITLCTGCHEVNGVSWSEADQAIPGASGSSHRWSAPVDNATYGASAPVGGELPLKVWGGQGWIVCSTCHNPHTQYYAPPDAGAPQAPGADGRHYQRVENGAGQMCLECHAARDIQYAGNGSWTGDPLSHPVRVPLPSGPTFFNPPQDVNGLPQVEVGTGPDADGNATNNVVLSDAGHGSYTKGDVECTSCHGVHYADSSSATIDDQPRPGDGMLLHRTNNDEACLGCHNLGIHNSNTMGTKYGTWGTAFACGTCHRPHATRNINLVSEVVTTPNSGDKGVDFRAANTGVEPHGLANAVAGAEGSGPCEVCHTQTTYYRNDASVDRTHNAGERCTMCHEHSRGFFASADDCLLCHRSPRGPRRAVEPDFSRLGHHPLAYDRAALTDPDSNNCLVCHLERGQSGGHKNGAVDYNPDPDGSGSSEWNGVNPSWWCLDCHDAASPGHLGGESAPDKTGYYASTHVQTPSPGAPVNCGFCHLGDPQYPFDQDYYPFDGNAHAPRQGGSYYITSSPTGAPVARGEDNKCFECHGGFVNVRRYDVPACPGSRAYMENIAQTMRGNGVMKNFPIGSRHLSTDPTDGATTCRRCHDPHGIDRYNNKLIFDPKSPGVPWSWSGNGTTPDDFCVRCHDGSEASPPVHAGLSLGVKKCIECHAPHGSTNRRLQVLSETEMAGITATLSPLAPAPVVVGSTLAFTLSSAGVPEDRRIDPIWTVTTLTGGSAPVEYTSTDGPVTIPDPPAYRPEGGVVSAINVPGSLTIYDLDVYVDMTHPSDCDFTLVLEHADTGQRVMLKSDLCWTPSAFGPTWYDQETKIASSARGDERLDTFYGTDARGTWELYVTDHWPSQVGTLNSYTLSFNNGVVGAIDDKGVFKAIAPGTATVRASIHSGRVRLTSQCASWWDLTETEVAASTDVAVSLTLLGRIRQPSAWTKAVTAKGYWQKLLGKKSLWRRLLWPATASQSHVAKKVIYRSARALRTAKVLRSPVVTPPMVHAGRTVDIAARSQGRIKCGDCHQDGASGTFR